jgi:hypothetical protein
MAEAAVQKPQIKIMAADWSLGGYPTRAKPWSIQTKVQKVKEAGFDGMASGANAELAAELHANGLELVGGVDVGSKNAAEENCRPLPTLASSISMCSCVTMIHPQRKP